MIANPHEGLLFFLEKILFHGMLRNKQLFLVLALRLNIKLWLMLLQRSFGFSLSLMNLECINPKFPSCGVIILVPHICRLIRSFMQEPSILMWIIILFEKELLKRSWIFVLSPLKIKLLMALLSLRQSAGYMSFVTISMLLVAKLASTLRLRGDVEIHNV